MEPFVLFLVAYSHYCAGLFRGWFPARPSAAIYDLDEERRRRRAA
jgi:hypothetical protein